MVEIKRQLAPERAIQTKTFGRLNKRKSITIHETGNTSRGADAQAHANIQSRINPRDASWNWEVDDKVAIQSFDNNVSCWAAGDGRGDGNMNSIHIEICVNSDGDYLKAVDNAAELVQYLMATEDIPASEVYQHNHWSGKNCPQNLRAGNKGINWSGFIAKVKGDEVYQVSKPIEKEPSKPTSGKTESIVDYLNSRNMDASFSARTKLAGQYGISGYKGTAEQNTLLLDRIRSGWKPAAKPEPSTVKTESIVDYLNRKGRDSSFGARSKLAAQYGIKGYKGTAAQNLLLLDRLRSGWKAPKPTKEYVQLPKIAETWKTYKLNVQPVSKNSDWSLTPARYGGLEYEVLGRPQANVVTIKTSKGKRNIYVASSTGAKFVKK